MPEHWKDKFDEFLAFFRIDTKQEHLIPQNVKGFSTTSILIYVTLTFVILQQYGYTTLLIN